MSFGNPHCNGFKYITETLMNKQKQAIETIANTDAMTGVKSKRAYLALEEELNTAIRQHKAEASRAMTGDITALYKLRIES